MVKFISVVAVQGDYSSHASKAGEYFKASKIFFVRKPSDFPPFSDLIIIPGGESSTIFLLSKIYGLDSKIKEEAKKGSAVFGTCAGSILLSKKILNGKKIEPWGFLDIEIQRNAYGRQLDSSVKKIYFTEETHKYTKEKTAEGVFIRAPKISKIGDGVEILATSDDDPVFLHKDRIIVSTFHPELSEGFEVYKIIRSIIS
ncbi:pyridoxal 5'-phosphate synthase glutaminase subunit PdxT [candidate division WOR-3 bacterium]|nr:pyridoxal 5'-phosphate synthase glutaminase subunit PdxT [candidate division WOR-3 bacterium]